MLEDMLQKRQMIYDKTLKGLKVQCRFSETIFLKKTLKTALNTFFIFFLFLIFSCFTCFGSQTC